MAERSIAERYVVERELGSGGMGTVYHGIDTRTNQPIAIKRLKSEVAQPEIIERFKREGEALRELNHPNIVKMLDAVEQDGNYYLVMEYVAGGDLKELIRHNGKLDYRACVDMAIDLADALTRAHRLHIIHRDLKPANVLIADDSTLRLTDFGIAHMAAKARVTETNAIMGTVDYLAPEVLSSEGFDARADIWAFGVMLFEMLTGEHPFSNPTLFATITAILNAPLPDLEALAPSAPIALVDLVYRMLERDPNARIGSVRHVGATLEDILEERDSTPPPTRFETPVSDFQTRTKPNLPAQTTPFVGREAELSELDKLIRTSQLRLITVLAPGGMGKTRLALEAAARHLDFFNHGVCFVDLTPLTNPANIMSSVGEALRLTFDNEDRHPPKQRVLDFLANKELLLVIDNWEHLLEGAGLVTEILQAAPDVQVLATSRLRLDQPAETLFHLSGMDFPAWQTPADALEYAAVKLFLNSAQRAQPSFELTSTNLDAVARICKLVAGMPLGLVLAASWLAMLSPEEIAEEISRGIDFLEAGGHEVSERQQSIQAVFDYSWQMLSDDEQHIFRQMSVFRGGFTRQAAQAITNASLRQLMNLVNKSMIRRDADSGRFRIHELLRQYAEARLKANDAGYQHICAEHGRYYLAFLEERGIWFKSGKQLEAGSEIEADFDNVRQAWLYAAQQRWFDRLEASYQGLSIFCSFWKTPGEMNHLHDAVLQACPADITSSICLIAQAMRATDVETIDELLKIAEAQQNTELFWYCYGKLIELHYKRRDYHKALEYAKQGVPIAEQLNDPFRLGRAYRNCLFFSGSLGDLPGWFMYLEKAFRVFEDHHDLLGLMYALDSMETKACIVEGDYERALDYNQRALTISEKLGADIERVSSLAGRAVLLLYVARVDEGKGWLQQAVALDIMTNLSQRDNFLESAHGLYACFAEKYDEAEQIAQETYRKTNNLAVLSELDTILIWVATARRDPEILRVLKQSALRIPGARAIAFTTMLFPGIAWHYARMGDVSYAVEICSIACHHPRSPVKMFAILPVVQGLIADLRRQLPNDEFTAAWEHGKTMDFVPVVKQLMDEGAVNMG